MRGPLSHGSLLDILTDSCWTRSAVSPLSPLNAQLVSAINRDYQQFVSLSSQVIFLLRRIGRRRIRHSRIAVAIDSHDTPARYQLIGGLHDNDLLRVFPLPAHRSFARSRSWTAWTPPSFACAFRSWRRRTSWATCQLLSPRANGRLQPLWRTMPHSPREPQVGGEVHILIAPSLLV